MICTTFLSNEIVGSVLMVFVEQSAVVCLLVASVMEALGVNVCQEIVNKLEGMKVMEDRLRKRDAFCVETEKLL